MVTSDKPQHPETLVPRWFVFGEECASVRTELGLDKTAVALPPQSRTLPSTDWRSTLSVGKVDSKHSSVSKLFPRTRRKGPRFYRRQFARTIRMDGACSGMRENHGKVSTRVLLQPRSPSVLVHVFFSNAFLFPISIPDSWDINKEIRALVKAPPNQVAHISGFQLCYSVRHLQVKIHLRLRRHFECLTKFLSKGLNFHRG